MEITKDKVKKAGILGGVVVTSFGIRKCFHH